MTEFSPELVKKVAKLARIKITEQEVQKFAGDLTAILTEIEKLQEVDTTDVIPLANVTEKPMRLRADKVTDGNCVEQVLSNAKNAQFNCYVVPKVVE